MEEEEDDVDISCHNTLTHSPTQTSFRAEAAAAVFTSRERAGGLGEAVCMNAPQGREQASKPVSPHRVLIICQ